MEKTFYDAKDIVKILGCKESKAYEIIKQLNQDLEEKYKKEGKKITTFRGKVLIWYFNEATGITRYYY